MRTWWRIGVGLVTISLVAGVAMQALTGQWFPPPVSISQYGVGRWGWVFSIFAVSLSASPLCFEHALGRGNRLARCLLWAGLAGAAVMAVIRTQAGGAQDTWNATVHMIGSIVCLAFLPLGLFALLWPLGRTWRWTASVILAAIGICMTLLLLAAAGHDTAGRGANASWAFWQAVAVVFCAAFGVSAAIATAGTGSVHERSHTPAGPVRRARVLD